MVRVCRKLKGCKKANGLGCKDLVPVAENERIVNVYRPNGTAKPGDATGKEEALASDFSYNVVSVVTLGLGEEIGS